MQRSDFGMLVHRGERWASQRNRSPLSVFGLVERQHTALQVHVGPAQREQLAPPSARREGQDHDGMQGLVLTLSTCRKQPVALLIAQEADASTWFSGFAHAAYGGIF